MNNYINIPLTTITLKAGDRVRLVEPEVLIERSNNPDITYHNEWKKDHILFSYEMLTLLSKCDTQEIKSIDTDGNIKFGDIPYKWPAEVILEPVDENDIAINRYIDSSKVDYVRIHKDRVDHDAWILYCSMPHAVLSNDKESVYFYTISQNDVNPYKHLEPECAKHEKT